MKRILAALLLIGALACSDDEVTVPAATGPLSAVSLTQIGADSLRVTFSVTQSYGVAVLRVRSASDLFFPVDSIPSNAPREFFTRFTDWISPLDTYGYVGVELGFGTNNNSRYVLIQQFTPSP